VSNPLLLLQRLAQKRGSPVDGAQVGFNAEFVRLEPGTTKNANGRMFPFVGAEGGDRTLTTIAGPRIIRS